MKSDWLFDKPGSNYWLRVTASDAGSQSPWLEMAPRDCRNPQ